MKNSKIQWITRTAALIALLIALQWATAGTQVFAGQYITGSLVNCVLAVAALFGGLWCGVTVAILSPFCAFALGIGPKLLQIVPCIAAGNIVYVLLLNRLLGGKRHPVWLQGLSLLIAAAAKFGALYAAVVKIVIPLMGSALKAPQVQTFTVMFSWPQLVTALLGGTVALLILPVFQKALQK
jgi:hypothetical protein